MASLSSAPRLRAKEIEFFEWPYTLRLPFRFGVITVTHGRQVVARVHIETEDGRSGWGVAAEALGAKWFDKDPAISDDDNLDQLRLALEIARDFYLAHGLDTAFGHFAAAYQPQIDKGAQHRLNPLVASYGPAMIDRCVIDALGKIIGRSFNDMIRANVPGIEPGRVVNDLQGFAFDRFLSELKPLAKLHVRHTVGMVDPIVAADQAPGARVNDGLPETLEEIVAYYGQTYFKLKVRGDLEQDVVRLTAIASVLDRIEKPYYASLDGNEQYADAASVIALWNAIEASPKLKRLRDSIIFIEQPIKRQVALAQDVSALAAKRPVILDESDGDLDAFPTGRKLGYAGISSKNCKGFYKSILNRARCAHWNAQEKTDRYFMSAEDLTTLAGISVQQDMALVALLGLTHVERNGHHFINGMGGRPIEEQRAFLKAHPSLYHEANGTVRMTIKDGMVDLASLDCPGFAVAAEPDWRSMERMPASKWR